jgi:hypothetical protein
MLLPTWHVPSREANELERTSGRAAIVEPSGAEIAGLN